MKKFLNNLGLKFQRFMAGRYGTDQLFRALLIAYLTVMIINAVAGRFSKIAYYALYAAGLIILIYAFFRVFSKNTEMRSYENRQYLAFIGKIKNSIALKRDKFSQRKTHKFVKCKSCKRVLRLPRHKGKIKVSCPHCKNEFIINTGKKV